MRKPKPDEFHVSPEGVTHRPTEATFTPHPGVPTSGYWRDGALGREHGMSYDADAVKTMMRHLWAEHLLNRT